MERRLWFLFFVSLFTICMASTSQNPFECRHPPKRKELEIFGVRSIYFSIPWNEPTMIVRRSGSLQTKFPIGPQFSENHLTLFFGHLYPTVFYFSRYGVFPDNPPNPLTFSFSGLRHFDGRLRKKVPTNHKNDSARFWLKSFFTLFQWCIFKWNFGNIFVHLELSLKVTTTT